MTIQSNIDSKEKAMQAVKDHCMCAKFEQGMVIFPDGYYPQGVRFQDTAKGYIDALSVMENTWINSFPS